MHILTYARRVDFYNNVYTISRVSKYTNLAKQIASFGAVGFVSLCIDLVVTSILYDLLHLPAYLSSGLGFMSAFFFSFPVSRKKVFRHTSKDRFSLQMQATLYFGLSLCNLVITSALVEFMVANNIVAIQFAKLIVTALIALWNFLIFKFVIFSKVR